MSTPGSPCRWLSPLPPPHASACLSVCQQPHSWPFISCHSSQVRRGNPPPSPSSPPGLSSSATSPRLGAHRRKTRIPRGYSLLLQTLHRVAWGADHSSPSEQEHTPEAHPQCPFLPGDLPSTPQDPSCLQGLFLALSSLT